MYIIGVRSAETPSTAESNLPPFLLSRIPLNATNVLLVPLPIYLPQACPILLLSSPLGGPAIFSPTDPMSNCGTALLFHQRVYNSIPN